MNNGFHRVFRLCLSLALAAVLTTLTWASLAHAQHPGDLDPTFNGTGVVTTSISGKNDGAGAWGIAIQPDGKSVAVGVSAGNNYDLAIVRYTITGSLDSTFNNTGVVTTSIGQNDLGIGVAIQSDGKIVVVGTTEEVGGVNNSYNFVIARYTITGSLDSAFNSTGIVTTDLGNNDGIFDAVVIQPDGKIVATGQSGNVITVIRYTITGSLDSEFNHTGIVTTAIGSYSNGSSVTLQPDGKIVVAGKSDNKITIVRYLITGSLDSDFNHTGIVTTTVGGSGGGGAVALQADGKIVVAGGTGGNNSDFVVLRYKNNGVLDTTFNDDGIVTTSITSLSDGATAVAIQPDNKIVVAGSVGINIYENYGDFAIVRYNSDGSLDTSFNHTGIVTTSISSTGPDDLMGAALQPADGKIVVAGYSCITNQCAFAVARYIGQYDHSAYLPVIFKE